MYYINAISSISYQNSFDTLGFSDKMISLEGKEELIKPDYKQIIGAKEIRRMSNILRMSVACSINCTTKVKEEIGAIIVGTGLGCLSDTFKFLNNFIVLDGLVPPTSFIQSTHNTIAGQISLALNNNGYNTTYTQNNISFEMALEDAMMVLDEGVGNVLLGAADEYIPFFKEIESQLNLKAVNLTEGATFLVLSKTKNEHTLAQIKDCKTTHNNSNKESFLNIFLEDNKIKKEEVDTVYYTNPLFNTILKEHKFNKQMDICKYAGCYATNSALALHIATDQIHLKKASRVLIYNNLNEINLGLTLIEAV